MDLNLRRSILSQPYSGWPTGQTVIEMNVSGLPTLILVVIDAIQRKTRHSGNYHVPQKAGTV